MAYIYKIINDINNKVYIGKTEFSIEKRWKEHCNDAFRKQFQHRPLYMAMQKYGIEHFYIELIEETNKPEEREKYWIEQYRSFKNGYNATLGGDGKKYIDYDVVVATYRELKSIIAVSEKLNLDYGHVGKILQAMNEPVLSAQQVSQQVCGKPVNQYDLEGNYLNTFPSAKAAAIALGKITSTSHGASSHISDVCRGKRKTAYGYKWKFANGE